jgi:hypothetical protein
MNGIGVGAQRMLTRRRFDHIERQWPMLVACTLVVFAGFFVIGRVSSGSSQPHTSSAVQAAALHVVAPVTSAIPATLSGSTPVPSAVPIKVVVPPPRRNSHSHPASPAIRIKTPFVPAATTVKAAQPTPSAPAPVATHSPAPTPAPTPTPTPARAPTPTPTRAPVKPAPTHAAPERSGGGGSFDSSG